MDLDENEHIRMGRVLQRLDGQDEQIKLLREDVRTLLEYANRGKGGVWLLSSIGAFLASIGWIVDHFWQR